MATGRYSVARPRLLIVLNILKGSLSWISVWSDAPNWSAHPAEMPQYGLYRMAHKGRTKLFRQRKWSKLVQMLWSKLQEYSHSIVCNQPSLFGYKNEEEKNGTFFIPFSAPLPFSHPTALTLSFRTPPSYYSFISNTTIQLRHPHPHPHVHIYFLPCLWTSKTPNLLLFEILISHLIYIIPFGVLQGLVCD